MKEDIKEFLKRIEELVDSGKYDWAEDTLLGIGETVETTERITTRQKEAVDNIEYSRS